MRIRFFIASAFTLGVVPVGLWAQEGPTAEELARKAQDPLADVRSIMTDNTIGFGTADDDTSYGFQIQPVYSISGGGANWITRGVVPIVGAPAGAGLPKLGPDQTPEKGTEWGLSDIILQLFWSPKSDADFKWGIGPQASLRTRTTDRVAGAGWGGGLGAVAFGSAGNIAYGALINHHWGQDNFNVSTIQPMFFYNINAIPGAYVAYNNSITYNWKAASGDKWQVPLGFIVGRTIPMGSRGDALDLNIGPYWLAAKPDGGADWQLKFGVSWFFP